MLLLLLLLAGCDARVLQQSPAQRGDAKQATSAKDALPLLALLVIPGFCLAQMQLDHWAARRKRAREAKHAEAEEAFGAGGSAGGAESGGGAAAKAVPPPVTDANTPSMPAREAAMQQQQAGESVITPPPA